MSTRCNTFWVLVDADGDCVLDIDGDPQVYCEIGPYAQSNAAHAGRRWVQMTLAESTPATVLDDLGAVTEATRGSPFGARLDGAGVARRF